MPGKCKTSDFTDYYSAKDRSPSNEVVANHCWNEILIKLFPGDTPYYKLVDPTWGSDGEVGGGTTINCNYFTMSNDEFIMDHYPSTELDGAMAKVFPADGGSSLPKYSHLQPVASGHVQANYIQWSTAGPPPFLLNTDIVDLIDRETLVPRSRTFRPRLISVSVEKKSPSQRFYRATGSQARIYGIDPELFKGVKAADLPVAAFNVKTACPHWTDGVSTKVGFYVMTEYRNGSRTKIYINFTRDAKFICTDSLIRDNKKSVLLYCSITDKPVAIWDIEDPIDDDSNNNNSAKPPSLDDLDDLIASFDILIGDAPASDYLEENGEVVEDVKPS